MKKLFIALMMMTVTISANAMSYEQARQEALFLTDKMAYELNLTDEQYEAAYEINLDYLMGVTSRDDVYGIYWERRNLDLSYILLDWQWNAFVAASYFYRPLYWDAGYWHFGVYLRYPHRDYFYFGRPHFYATYRGGHAWHHHGAHGYYHGHSNHYRAPHREHFGMHDRWNRGDFRGPRHSSTRITGHDGHRRIEGRDGQRRIENRREGGSFSGHRGGGDFSGHRSGGDVRHNDVRRNNDVRHNDVRRNNDVRQNSHSGSGNFSGSRSGGSRSGGSFSGSRSGGSHSGGFSGSRSGGFSSSHSSTRSGSFGGSHSGGSRSGGFSSGGSRSGGFSGGSHGGGGSHGHSNGSRMGGHR